MNDTWCNLQDYVNFNTAIVSYIEAQPSSSNSVTYFKNELKKENSKLSVIISTVSKSKPEGFYNLSYLTEIQNILIELNKLVDFTQMNLPSITIDSNYTIYKTNKSILWHTLLDTKTIPADVQSLIQKELNICGLGISLDYFNKRLFETVSAMPNKSA